MFLSFAVALAADSADWHAAQARAFVKKGWTADAEAEVAAGLALDEHHVELNSVCVELAQLAGDIERAIHCAAMGAAAPTGNLDARARLSQLESWLRTNFGWVELRGPEGVDHAVLTLESTSLQLDAALQTATAETATRLRSGVHLPTKLALPIGDYAVLGEPVHVEAGQTRVLTLPAARFTAAAARGRRFDASVGAMVYSGVDFANQLPGVSMELSLSIPTGPARLGIGASWDARGYSGVDLASAVAPNTVAGLVRFSVPLEVGSAVALVPGISVRAAMLPGLELACTRDDEPHACTPGRANDAQLPVYANGFGVVPAAELGAELVHGRFVFGVRGSIGHVFALLPDPGELLHDGATETWQSDRTTLHAGVYSLAGTFGLGW